MRLAKEATAVSVALDENDVAVQRGLANCDTVRGNALTQLGRDGESMLAQQAALRRFELLGNAAGIIAALGNIGEHLMTSGRYDDALRHLRLAEARAQASPVEFSEQLALLPGAMGDVLACLGRNAEAVDLLQLCKARSVSFFGERSPQVIAVCTKLAKVLISIADYTGAAEQLREAEMIFEQRGWKDAEGGVVHARFGELAAKQGRPRMLWRDLSAASPYSAGSTRMGILTRHS